MNVRLSKLMAERGICSRREADRYIEQEQVLVNGEIVAVLGTKVPIDARIELKRGAQKKQDSKKTILLNKPIGFVSTQPEDGYRAAHELLPPQYRHFNTAGRLDIDSKGLLVLTENGTIAKQLIGQNSSVEKEYLVRVEGEITQEKIKRLRHGLWLDNQPLKPAKINQLEHQLLSFTLREGKKRQIRRMCEQVGLFVVGLKRVRIGKVMLGNLPEGKWRFLEEFETFE